MEPSNKNERSSSEQMAIMLEFMEQHTLFARKQIPKLGPRGHEKYQQMWQELSTLLNNHGPAVKNVKGWTDAWKNLRLFCKNKKAAYVNAKNKTGNPAIKLNPLNNFEERVCTIFGKFGSGEPLIREIGLNNRNKASPVDCSTMEIEHLKIESIRGKNKEKRDRQRPTREQFVAMVTFIESNPLLADGVVSVANAHIWKELADLLNSLPGGAVREIRSWITSWKDLKNRVKQKRQEILLPKPGEELNPSRNFNLRVLNIIDCEGGNMQQSANPRERCPLKSIQNQPSTSTTTTAISSNQGNFRKPSDALPQENTLPAVLQKKLSSSLVSQQNSSGFANLLNLIDSSNKKRPIIDLTSDEDDKTIPPRKVRQVRESKESFLEAVKEQNSSINKCSVLFIQELKNIKETMAKGFSAIANAIQNQYNIHDNTMDYTDDKNVNVKVEKTEENDFKNLDSMELPNDLLNCEDDVTSEYEVELKYTDL